MTEEYMSRIGMWGPGSDKITPKLIKKFLENCGADDVDVKIVKGIIYVLIDSDVDDRDSYLLWLNEEFSDVDFGSPEEMRIVKMC